MDGRGVRFQGNLDPTAEEFRPQNASQPPNQFALIHPQVYYRYPCSSSYPVSFEGVHPPSAYIRPTPRPTLTNAASSRSLLLSLVPLHVTESMVRTELEVFGAVRAVQTESIGEGIVTVHFYDLRHAQAALMEIQEQHMKQQSRLGQHYSSLLMGDWGCDGGNSTVPMPLPGSRGLVGGQAVWAQFAVPSAIAGIPDWQNQGTLVVFNLDEDVSTSMIKELFEAFGPVKELRETPMKRQHRFVEFYDVRDAARALLEMSGKEVNGKRLVVEFGRPGGQGRRLSSSAESSSNTKNSSSSSTNYRRNASCPRLFGHSSEAVQVLPHSFHQTKKSGFGRESAASSSMAGTATEGQHDYPLRRNSRKNPTNYAPSQSNQSIRRSSSSRNRHQKRQVDANFLFKEDAIEEANIKDTRTTVMIKNIPNKYSQKLLLNMLDNHCIHCNEQIAERGGDEEGEPLSAYDFVYLPIDFTNKCNVGYGFVNLTSPEAAWRLYKSFHLQAWEVFNSRKICQVTYARLQGLDALKEHFRNSKFACDTDEYLPVVFSPPRDGKLLTEPVAIGGHAGNVQKAARDRRRRKVDDLPQMDGGDWSTTSSNKVDGGDDDEDHEDVGDDGRLSEVLLSSCALSTEEAQQQRNGLSCGRVS